MNSLLVGDTHFDDNKLNDYRWELFGHLQNICREHKVREVFFLGDFVDRKDRHAGAFVNELIDNLELLAREAAIGILEGNHDGPDTEGIAYWQFLDHLKAKVSYYWQPWLSPDVAILPWTKNPLEAWKSIDFSKYPVVLMHQTISGALVENDRRMEDANPMPIFPRGLPVFSGDVHRPQTIGSVTYVGAPYPVRFSESWPNRVMLIRDSDWKHPIEIPLRIRKRAILDLTEVPRNFDAFEPADQVRIRFHLDAAQLAAWPRLEVSIREQAQKAQVEIASLEPVIERELFEQAARERVELMKPLDVLELFADRENLSNEVLDLGIELLREARK